MDIIWFVLYVLPMYLIICNKLKVINLVKNHY